MGAPFILCLLGQRPSIAISHIMARDSEGAAAQVNLITIPSYKPTVTLTRNDLRLRDADPVVPVPSRYISYSECFGSASMTVLSTRSSLVSL